MTSKARIDEFLQQEAIAVVGASRSTRKFGNTVYHDLQKKGYQVFAVNRSGEAVDGDASYKTLADLPTTVNAAVLVIPPAESEKVVQEAAKAGVKQIWLQPGAESQSVIRYCEQNGISVIAGECIMMFARGDQFPHNVHRWVNKITGKLPK
jgi:uncharacterized protein